MKSKPKKRPNPDLEQDDEDVEVEDDGPEIAAGKKSKVTVLFASIVLSIVVVYLFFIKDNAPKEDLVKVSVPEIANVARSDSGKSPFEIEVPKDEAKTNVDILAQPATPDLPTLPELPKDAIVPEKINLIEDKKQAEQQLPMQQQAGQQAGQQQAASNLRQESAQNNSGQDAQVDKKLDPRYAPIVIFSGATEGGTVPSRGVGYENNIVTIKKNSIDDLQVTTTAVSATRISDLAHTIAQGKLLTAVLETAINTELPGSVRAVVSRDVFGEAGNEVLIPKGSRLFGSYSSKVSRGQARVEIGWTRLIRPDGVDMAINFNASDQFGRAGLVGDVDNKYNSLIANSIMTSVLAIGGVAAAQSILTGNSATTTTTNPTQGTTTSTGSATNQALYDVTKTIIDTVGQLISNTIDLNPVIRVPQGTKITVIVNSDITVPSIKR
jgi:type IV secretion system protein VirB10